MGRDPITLVLTWVFRKKFREKIRITLRIVEACSRIKNSEYLYITSPEVWGQAGLIYCSVPDA